MSIFTNDNFPEIKSEPNWFLTWCIRVLFLMIFGSLIILIYAIPLAFYIDGTIEGVQLFGFGIIYYPVVIWLSYIGVQYLERIKSKAVRHITVNGEGVFYGQIAGSVESLLYSQLEKSSVDRIVYDIFIGSDLVYTADATYRQTFLKVFLKGNEQELRPFHPGVIYSYYAQNSRLLRSHFIQGVTLFRPDLCIAPNVYSTFSIRPQTFEFDKKGYCKGIIIATIVIILIVICVEWYMKYRFGESFLF